MGNAASALGNVKNAHVLVCDTTVLQTFCAEVSRPREASCSREHIAQYGAP